MTADAAGGEPPAGTPPPTGPDHPELDAGWSTGERPLVDPAAPGVTGPRLRVRPYVTTTPKPPGAAPESGGAPVTRGRSGGTTPVPRRKRPDADEPPPFRIGGPVIEPQAGSRAKAPTPKKRSGSRAPREPSGSGALAPDPDPDAEPATFRPWERTKSRNRGEAPDARATARPRPFVLTAGRVAAEIPYIGLETQVTVRPGSAPSPDLPPQQSAIVTLCAEPTSVAEIAALLGMHLGVTRILVADLHTAGLLDVPGATANLATDPDLIMRVMRGIRDLT